MGVIPPEKIDDVRAASDIVDVISGYMTLQSKGRNYFGLCPFHQEKTPSFSVNPEMQIFHCFGCGVGGNVFTFIMKMEGITFPDAVKMLAQTAGILLPEDSEDFSEYRDKEALFYANKMANDFFYKTLLENSEAVEAQKYLENRGISKDYIKEFNIGWAPNSWDGLIKLANKQSVPLSILSKAGLVIEKEQGGFYDRFRGRITFAIQNLTGQIVGFGARRITEDDSPKYINTPETDIYQKRFILYGLHQGRDEIRRNDRVIIVEGYTDVTSLHKYGIPNTVATSGTALTEHQAKILRRYTPNAIILYDSDSAGAKAAIRGADILLENGMEVKICTLPKGMDPDEFARTEGTEAVKETLEKSTPLIDFKLNNLREQGLLGTASQQADAMRDILTSVVKINDHIQRSFLIRDLAEKFHVEESVLWTEIKSLDRKNKAKLSQASEQKKQTQNTFFDTKRGAAELGLLQTAFLNPEIIPLILTNISKLEFKNTEIHSVFVQIANDLNSNLSFVPQKYLGTIQDPAILSSLSHILSKNVERGQTWQYAKDCIISIKISICDEEINRVRKEMQQSSDKIAELMLEYKNLQEAKKFILSGQTIQEDLHLSETQESDTSA